MDQARFENAVALRKSGRILDAIQEFQAMEEESTDVNERTALMLNEVRCYVDLGRVVDAERILARIQALPPDNVDMDIRLIIDFVAACTAAQAEHYEQAVREFQTQLEEYVELLQIPDFRDFYEDIQQRSGILPNPSPQIRGSSSDPKRS